MVSCVRLALLIHWFNQFYKGLGSKDIYYSFGWAVSPIECNLAIVAASIPALWPIFRKAFPSVFSDFDTSYPANSYRVNAQPSGTGRATAFRSTAGRSRGASRLDDESDDMYIMKPMRGNGQVDCRSTTPTGSQDGIIDFKDGIMRTTDVEIGYEDGSKEREQGNDRDEYGRRKNVAYVI